MGPVWSLGLAAGLAVLPAMAERVPVQFPEGSVHAFLQVSGLDGKVIAGGDLVEVAKGDEVSVRLVFRFKDGSLDDERTVYSQRGHFRLVSNRHVQRGPSFTHPMDVELETATGTVTTRHEEGGREIASSEHMDLPADLANGMVLQMVKNLPSTGPATTVRYLAATPKPRLIHLVLTPTGTAPFTVGGVRHEAVRYTLKPEIGGIEGVLAPMVGKDPKQTEVWISGGDVPAFARLEGPTFLGGPHWRLEMARPNWPVAAGASADAKVVH